MLGLRPKEQSMAIAWLAAAAAFVLELLGDFSYAAPVVIQPEYTIIVIGYYRL